MDLTQINPNICEVKGHNNKQLIPYLCMSPSCDSTSRYLCQECLIDVLHYHNGLKPQILSQEQILAYYQQNLTLLKQNHLEKLKSFQIQYIETLKIIADIEDIIKNLKCYQQFEEGVVFTDSDENYFMSLKNMISEQFFQLSPEIISKIMNISDYQLENQKIEQFNNDFEKFISKFEQLKIQINSFKIQDYLYTSQINIDEQIRKSVYSDDKNSQIKDLIQGELSFNKSRISHNNRYIALVRRKYEPLSYIPFKYYFDLIDLQTKKMFKMRYRNTQIDFLQFSFDSQLLYYKENNESFYCYNINADNFQEFRHFPELLDTQFILATKWNRAFILNKNKQLQLLDMEYQYVSNKRKILINQFMIA